MEKLINSSELAALREHLLLKKKANGVSITVCSGTGCLACRAADLGTAFEEELDLQGLRGAVEVRRSGCFGFCERGPVVLLRPSNIMYFKVQVGDVREIVEKTICNGKPVTRLLYHDPQTEEPVDTMEKIPFYKHQTRLLLATNPYIDPFSIYDYIANGGYKALAKALNELTPEQLIDDMKKANLRGRGGGGFPAGVKWEITRKAPGDVKYVVVNGDEGDPGAYMDRSLLEGNPHSVLEGLIIGAYAIGASEGYIYVRQEYPLATATLKIAIDEARAAGLLGKNILGSGFDFDVTIHRGAGAFVSGESSALMSAIEGHVGEPKPKYVHTSIKGLWDKPTCLNNVETWANVPLIVTHGVEWFRSMGTGGSKGTKIFSLVGNVNNSGLVEVPMGMSLRDIVFKIGGGIPKGKAIKAVQTGGPSGGVIPESQLDLPVDFDALDQAGSMMGSGGLIVMDEDSCMVDTARFYVEFLAHESCGKCVPCREGLRQMLKIFNRIVSGQGQPGDIELLEEICEFMSLASMCALGKTAANPVLSTIRHFRSEYEAHITEKRCPALVCKELIRFAIDPAKCTGCGLCAKSCPTNAISKLDSGVYQVDDARCIKCGSCELACPPKFAALTRVHDPKTASVGQR